MNGPTNSNAKARWWIATIGKDKWDGKKLPPGAIYAKGQLERGAGGFEHWQVCFQFSEPKRRAHLSKWIRECFYEPTKSDAALEYVWKEESRIGEPFELGSRGLRRNDKTDWEQIRQFAETGQLERVPGDVYIRYYGNLQVFLI